MIAVLSVLIVGFSVFSVYPEKTTNQNKVAEPLRIGINVWPGCAHAYIAENKGLFLKNGVQVQLVLQQNLEQGIKNYKDGNLDGLFDVFSNTIVQIASGFFVKVVYISDYSLSGDVIVGRKEFDSLADLKGRKVSFESLNSFSHIYVLKSLETHGLDESMVLFDIVPPLEVLSALESGRIDAGHTWEPITSRALAKGYKILSRAGDVPGIITDVLTFTSDIVKKRPNEVQAVVRALLEAVDYVTAHPDESMAIMAEAEGMTNEEMLSGWNGVFHLDRAANAAAMTLPGASSLHTTGDYIIKYLKSRGQLREIPRLDKTIDARFVDMIAISESHP